jgi:hypothetical protein
MQNRRLPGDYNEFFALSAKVGNSRHNLSIRWRDGISTSNVADSRRSVALGCPHDGQHVERCDMEPGLGLSARAYYVAPLGDVPHLESACFP